eukprot:12819129-Alexandrium_andersonii.AAC.1
MGYPPIRNPHNPLLVARAQTRPQILPGEATVSTRPRGQAALESAEIGDPRLPGASERDLHSGAPRTSAACEATKGPLGSLG